jgi:cell division protein FtsI (penicillin-binding protein 3)
VVLLIFMGLLLFFLGRLITFYVFRAGFLSQLAAKQHTYYLELEPQRGGIYDRNMHSLAVNVATYSLYAVPPQVKNPQAVTKALGEILGLDKDFIEQRLSRQKQFVWLARKLDWARMEKIRACGLAGLNFIKESKRSYPNAKMACQLLGFAGLDNVGLDGLERAQDAYLRGTPGWTYVFRDARQRNLSMDDVLQPPVDGSSLVLTIDEVIQYIVEREADRVIEKYHPKGLSIVVLDTKLTNRPAYDCNEPGSYPTDARRNRSVTDFFEPGSVFKIVTASAALDEGVFSLGDKVFCENGKYRVANHILHDVHPYGWLTFKEVIGQSSNIGTTKVAQKLGAQKIYDYAHAFGIGTSTGSGIPGEVSGVLKPVSVWSKNSIGAVPIGQEVCVTALQLVSAIATIANNGVLMKPYVLGAIVDKKGEVLKSFGPEQVRRVITDETSQKMREVLEGVVLTGTGKLAGSSLYRMAGKTGTAQKVEANGTYSHSKFIGSFIGFAPVEDPRIAVVVMADEPHPYYYGGVVSAPAFRAIAEDVLKYLQVPESEKPVVAGAAAGASISPGD